MGSPGNVGVRLADHNHLKYTLVITRVGLLIFNHVFTWGFKSGAGSIKDALFAPDSYSMVRFRKDFNASQRKKLERNNRSDFDISLIYKLIQMLCGLRPADDPVWTDESSHSLENCLYKIKSKRNEIAHENINMSPDELGAILDELKSLFTKTLEDAGKMFNIESCKVNAVLSSVTSEVDAIRDSPVPVATLAEYEQEVLATRRIQVMEAASRESAQIHSNMCQVSVAPWLMSGHNVSIDTIFTSPALKRDQFEIRQRQLSEDESRVEVHKILQAQHSDGSYPQVILVSAVSGMGKSSLLKYILNKAAGSRREINSMEKYDLILSFDCRNHKFSSLEEVMNLLLPRTAAMFQQDHFKTALTSLDLLIVMDNIDELDQLSFTSFMVFLKTVSKESRILATVSQEKATSIQRQLQTFSTRVLVLEIDGIPDDLMVTFMQRTIKCLNSHRKGGVIDERELCGLITSQRPHLQDHLKSPEVLSLIALIWAMSCGRINTSTTVTEMFMLVEELLLHKVLQNLPGFTSSDISLQNTLQSGLNEFVLSLSGVALKCIKKGTCVIDAKDVEYLTQECKRLNLPPSHIIPAFLNNTTNAENIPLGSQVVSFPRKSTLYYYAAWFLLHHLQETTSPSTIQDIMGLKNTDFTENQISGLQCVMKHLVGMLAIKNSNQLKVRALEIVDMLKSLNVCKASQWLQYVEEAKGDQSVTQIIVKEMGTVWEVENAAISQVLADILKKNKPQHLILTTTDSPAKYPHLEEILKTCSASSGMKLSLHLYHHFWTEKISDSDKFINILVNARKPCILEHFAGRLSSSTIKKLPKSLKRLAIHVTVDMLKSLNSILPSLTNLELLYLNLDVPTTTDPHELSCLRLPTPHTSLSVDMWGITVESLPWACDAAKSLATCYTRLVLRRSDLTAGQCRRWVGELQKRRMAVSWLVVGSSHAITSKHKERLLAAANPIGCNKLDWIKV